MEDVIVINREKLKESIRKYLFSNPDNDEDRQINEALEMLCDKVDADFENVLALTIISAMIVASGWGEPK